MTKDQAIDELRMALQASQDWLYGHSNEEGQRNRRAKNEDVLKRTLNVGDARVVEFRGIEDLLRAASKVSVPEDLADDPRLKSYGAQFATMLLQRGGE